MLAKKGFVLLRGRFFPLGGKGIFEPTTQTDPQEVQFIDLEGPPFFDTNIMNRLEHFFFSWSYNLSKLDFEWSSCSPLLFWVC